MTNTTQTVNPVDYRDFVAALAADLIETAKDVEMDPRELLDSYIEQFGEAMAMELDEQLDDAEQK